MADLRISSHVPRNSKVSKTYQWSAMSTAEGILNCIRGMYYVQSTKCLAAASLCIVSD